MSASETITPATTVKNTILLSVCISVGFALITEYAGIDVPLPIDLQSFLDEQQNEAETLSDSDGFNTAFIFGDFLRITQAIIYAVFQQYLPGVLEMLGFNPTFVMGMRVIGFLYGAWTVYYLVSGRMM
ncbi:hypothetical protein [Nitrososphaera sp.]|uniref:hypothetical protein n=1 Tax=Nitrososphaera sp. TaxID=1971748 RepID=UPI00184CC573|nr:hypothetical protein [Nitrososphaera sp.]NWG37830.1 hypothetical protein [Nitrososphaera sp.]